jgi:hypothetical protein
VADRTNILGVDFSGAKADKNTWVTQGTLHDGVLEIESCRPTPRAELAALLGSAPKNTIAALDFPFSVPRQFANHWLPEAESMPQLWQAAAGMEFQDFMALRDEFVADHGEPYRRGDLYFPECYSCLHKTNPNMVPMTFRGMHMLDGLWQLGCRVPPLPDDGPTGPALQESIPNKPYTGPLLLESMPGAALRALGLPFKGYKKGRHAVDLRRQILDGLETRSGISLPNLGQFRDYCMGNDDCLDSVAAAVAACLWANDQALFRLPQDGPGDVSQRGGTPSPGENELQTARLEGWLYAPVYLIQPS